MRPIVQSIPLLRKIRQANEHWFTPDNKRFFKDRSYYGYYGGTTGKSYLVQSTYAWTDMFGEKPRLHYRIHTLNQDTEEIGNLLDTEFKTLDDIKSWLREN
jgi:hypothetical protein